MHRLIAVPRVLLLLVILGLLSTGTVVPASDSLAWPAISREARPWTYWWWMGSAVDKENISRELQRFRDAGFGGVHIIPIYGARGYEEKFIPYLSPRWMGMLSHAVSEASRLGLGVDMTTGSGWCFGGPVVTEMLGTAQVVVRTFDLADGSNLEEKLDAQSLQALVAFKNGTSVDLLQDLGPDGRLGRTFEQGPWRVYAVSQRSSRQRVKRAAPGGEGLMLNPLSANSMRQYLTWFADAFEHYSGPKPRAMYHDSYEYSSTWAPDLLKSFAERRGYRLQDELPFLFHDPAKDAPRDLDRVARVKADYRETISEVIADDYLSPWVSWSRSNGFIVRNEAHGSPANWLDLYALADIPETEMFHLDRSQLISKFASSAAHLKGKKLVSSETGTWLKEHFTETLADAKYLLDELFLSGVNHIFYHGSCYSPAEAPWPGWLFYASLQMNWRNPIWRDVPALNSYAARCQAVLQSGSADNDLLLYWPIHDVWHNPTGMVQTFTVHSRGWFESQPIGHTAEVLLRSGYAFDYVSDRLLAEARVAGGAVLLPGGEYRAIVVPPLTRMPVATMRRLVNLARAGALIIFQDMLPSDVPGLANLEERRAELKALVAGLRLPPGPGGFSRAKVGEGVVVCGALGVALVQGGVAPERMFSKPGLMCIRRRLPDGTFYFIANPVTNSAVEGWVPLARVTRSAAILDPMTGGAGIARLRTAGETGTEVFLQLQPGESCIVRCFATEEARGQAWTYLGQPGLPVLLTGPWHIEFIEGGPELPAPLETSELRPWATFADPNLTRFAGTARYRLEFPAAPGAARQWLLDLGAVAQSARIRVNGQDRGTLLTRPFRLVVDSLKESGNVLEVEVTSVAANRIRDLDRRGVKWKNFHDINFVGIDYKPFDASQWPVTDCGLIGPVTLAPLAPGETNPRN